MAVRLLAHTRAALRQLRHHPGTLRHLGGAALVVVLVVLLLGGLGTVASWRAADEVDAGGVGTGALELETDATNAGCAAWEFSGSAVRPDGPYTGQLLEPGDVLVRSCAFTLRAAGDHLTGTVEASVSPSAPGLPAGVVLTVTDVAPTTFTEADDGAAVEVTLRLAVQTDEPVPAMDVEAVVSGITVAAVQEQP